jgi:hypothetical protein
MSSMRFNTRLDASHHRPTHLFKDARVVADSLTGIYNVIVKCLFVVNRSCIHNGLYMTLQVKIQRIQIRRVQRPCSGPSSTYPLVMIRVTENISHSMAKL